MVVFKGTEFKKWHLFCAQTTPSLSVCLIFVLGKLNRVDSGRQNFRKYMLLFVGPAFNP